MAARRTRGAVRRWAASCARSAVAKGVLAKRTGAMDRAVRMSVAGAFLSAALASTTMVELRSGALSAALVSTSVAHVVCTQEMGCAVVSEG